MQDVMEMFQEAKESTARHQKLLQKLALLKKQTDSDGFFDAFFHCIRVIFHADLKTNKTEVHRVMLFAVKFCLNNAGKQKTTTAAGDDEDSVEMDEFLRRVLHETLKYHDVDVVGVRYRCCQFVAMLLKEIGDEGIDDDAWDAIQEAMLERLEDPKPLVRQQAITAVFRLQVPTDNGCPVIKELMKRLYDINATVRKTVVENIGPNATTIVRIVERLLDIDEQVRAAAFRKCATIGPDYIKIANRQRVLRCGFFEKCAVTKRAFTEQLIPRWLDTYNDDMIVFFRKVVLDADEEDLEDTFRIYRDLMGVYCKGRTFEVVTEILPLNENKFVPVDELSFEVVSYWNLLAEYLRRMEEGDEYLDRIMPDLVDMCKYIENFIEKKFSNKMEEYEISILEYTIYLLFDMVEQYDLGDEVSRNTLHKLINDILLKYTFHSRLLDKLMKILAQLHNNNNYELTREVCELVSEIREPLVSVKPSEHEMREYNFKIAKLGVEIDILTENRDKAVKDADYIQAHNLKQQLDEATEQLAHLQNAVTEKKEKRTQDGPETTVRCLDILIALLKQPTVNQLTPFLQTCKDMYLEQFISNPIAEIFWRAMKLLVLYCLIDREIMVGNCKRIFGALAFYKMTPYYEKNALFVTVDSVSDLLRVYGTDILQTAEVNSTKTDDVVAQNNASSSRRRIGGRRLYNADSNGDFDIENVGEITFKDVLDILADLMDDECSEVKLRAGTALIRLLLDGLCSSASLLSRLILKWHTLEFGTKLQQMLGVALVQYAQDVDGSEDVIEKAVIPTLISVAKAPKNSPLVDVNVDSLIRYLKTVTSIKVKQNVLICAHSNIAQAILHKINAHPEDISVHILTKMLLQLQVTLFTRTSCKELINQVKIALEVVKEKICQKNLTKFTGQLDEQLTKHPSSPMETVVEEDENNMETIVNQTESLRLADKTTTTTSSANKVNTPASAVKRKRRKSRKNLDESSTTVTNLHTITDSTLEQMLTNDDVPIASCDTSNSSSGHSVRRSQRTIVYTSTDSESSQKNTIRRTKRKKR